MTMPGALAEDLEEDGARGNERVEDTVGRWSEVRPGRSGSLARESPGRKKTHPTMTIVGNTKPAATLPKRSRRLPYAGAVVYSIPLQGSPGDQPLPHSKVKPGREKRHTCSGRRPLP